jgi:hypothetical protein
MVLLQQELAFISTNHQALAIAHALRSPTADEARYRVIALDLWGMLVEHCRGITLLLSDGLIYSARVLSRTAAETSMHLMYLATVGDKYENARLYETNMLFEVNKQLAPTEPMEETRKTLEAVPVDIRERVEQIRKNTRLQWCGRTRGEMAAAVGIVQYKGTFAVLSCAVSFGIPPLGAQRC